MALSATPVQGAVEAWVQRYSAADHDYARKVVTDNAGNVFVTGSSRGTNGFYDYATIKYSGAGVPLWTNRYDNGSHDYAWAIAVDGGSNVFVTGQSAGSGTSFDYATVAYSGAGLPLWTNRYDNGSDDYANAIAVDGSGNVFVTGDSVGIGTSFDYATVAYSGAGVPLWTNRYNGPANGGLFFNALAVGGNGNVFVTGQLRGTNGFFDYATVAYSGAGAPLWTNRYNGPANSNDVVTAIAVGASGNVFVTGWSVGIGSFVDYATVAYSGAGVPLWTNRYNGPANSYDDAYAIAVDASGNVFVTGPSIGTGSYDYATVAYSGAGLPLWTNRYNGPANGYDQANAIAVDRSGNVFVTGWSVGSGSGNDDYATVAYSGAGLPLWTNRYDGHGLADSEDQAFAIAVDGDGNVFVTGESRGSDGTYDYVTIKYWGVGPHIAVEPDGAGGYFLRFNGIPGTAYRFERATTLTGPWDPSVQVQTAPTSGRVEFRDASPPPGQAFYRVRTE